MTDCPHDKVIPDQFALLPGVRRCLPGDCACMDCGQPLAVWWNAGKPIPVPVTTPPLQIDPDTGVMASPETMDEAKAEWMERNHEEWQADQASYRGFEK